MKITLIVLIVIFAAIAAIGYAANQYNQYRRRQQRGEARQQTPAPAYYGWLKANWQNLAIGLLLALLIIMIFPDRVWRMVTQYPIGVPIVLALIAIIILAGPSNLKKWGHWIALPCLIAALIVFLFIPGATEKVKIGIAAQEPQEQAQKQVMPAPKTDRPKQEETFSLASYEKKITVLKFERGDIIEFKQEKGKSFTILNDNLPDEKIEISETVRCGINPGYIIILNGPEQNIVKVRIKPA